jgi:putative sterol carrier protein
VGLRLVRPPELLLDAAAKVGELLEKVAKVDAIDPAWHRNGDVTMVMDSEKARRELGWKPTADTCADVLRRYMDAAPGKMDRRISTFFALLGRMAERDTSQRELMDRMKANVHLRLLGRGGGDITLSVMDGKFGVRRGIPRPPTSVVTISTDLFREMLTGKASFATAQLTGRVKIQGEVEAGFMIGGMTRRLELARKQEGMRGQAARLFSRWLEGGAS